MAVSMTTRLQATPWTLTEQALDKLLRVLDADRDRAGGKYESLRRRLVTFFECRACRDAGDCADETINRVARRLDQGERIHAVDPMVYFLGVARYVARERYAEHSRERRTLDLFRHRLRQTTASEPLESPGHEPIECARHCLQLLAPEDRTLILLYYRGEKGTKISNRHRLANQLNIAPNALRIRAYRIRQRLEACMGACLAAHHRLK
jgi:DNA-directed RNA polymerase specialized sigma24 family protein